MVDRFQERIRDASMDLLVFAVRTFTGLVLGFTFGLILQQGLGYAPGEGTLILVFAVVMTTALVLRLTRGWSLFSVLILDLILVLIGLLLRLYVMVAPNLK
jgi:hypothetical protein